MKKISIALALLTASSGGAALASSHREAPFITKMPKVDATDFYLFKSYEKSREQYVTVVANYVPLQDAYGGPNYFTMDSEAAYEIHLDNDGDAREDLTFRFRFSNDLANQTGLTVPVGDKNTPVPLINIGPLTGPGASMPNVKETYTVSLVRGTRRGGQALMMAGTDNTTTFVKPTDNIGTKSFPAPGYAEYAKKHIYNVRIPGCDLPARVFVGQRAESFAVNLGTIFDLVNAPLEVITGAKGRDLGANVLADKNITSLALELPIKCVKGKGDVIGGWTTASLRQARILNPRASYKLPALEVGAWTQVSRLSNPLVNEVVIGLKDKDLFNTSEPKDDGQFAAYVTHPSLPKLLDVLFGAMVGGKIEPTVPRTDLVTAFLKGVEGVNANGSTAEMVRLNTALPATPKGKQNSLGAAGCFKAGVLTVANNPDCDAAGFPNGRRPGDDTVDIALRVMMGYLIGNTNNAPVWNVAFTDGAIQNDSQFDELFPYLRTPHPGAK